MGLETSGNEHLLSIRVEQWNGMARVRLSGELDMSNQARLERAIRTAEEHGKQGIRVDLTEVQFMDSSALSVLLGARQRADEAERELIVRGAQGEVWKLFQLAGVHEVFPGADGMEFTPSLEEPTEWSHMPHETEPEPE